MKKEFNIIAKLIGPESKVLDHGWGDGELMEYIYKKNLRFITYANCRMAFYSFNQADRTVFINDSIIYYHFFLCFYFFSKL